MFVGLYLRKEGHDGGACVSADDRDGLLVNISAHRLRVPSAPPKLVAFTLVVTWRHRSSDGRGCFCSRLDCRALSGQPTSDTKVRARTTSRVVTPKRRLGSYTPFCFNTWCLCAYRCVSVRACGASECSAQHRLHQSQASICFPLVRADPTPIRGHAHENDARTA